MQDGALNFFFGGALGALVEASVPPYDSGELKENEQYQIAFYSAIFGSAAKLVRADGVILDFELETVRQFIHETLQLESSWERFALSLFSQAGESYTPVEHYLQQFAEIVEYDNEVCESFLNFLTALSICDGEFHPAEKKILITAEELFKLPAGSVAKILTQYGWSMETGKRIVDTAEGISLSYALLEIPETASIEDVEVAFRAKTEEFSPQIASNKGLPPQFVKFANERFVEICGAYTNIMSELRDS